MKNFEFNVFKEQRDEGDTNDLLWSKFPNTESSV